MSTPIQIEAELKDLAEQIDVWDLRWAWFEAKRDYLKTRLSIAEARAAMEYTGPATKSKFYAVAGTEDERIALDIGAAELLLCSRKMHSLEKTLLTVMGRNKSASNSYNLGY